MPQDFIPPLVYAESPFDGDLRVGRAASFHIRCVDLGNDEAELDPSTLTIDVHYRPEDPDMVNAPWPHQRVYENNSFVAGNAWFSGSTVDFNDGDLPTEVNIYLRRDTLASYGEQLRVMVGISDKANNRTVRELSYGFIRDQSYKGDSPDSLESEMLRPFGVVEIDGFIDELSSLLVDPAGVDPAVLPFLATRRSLNILKVLNMEAALKGLFIVDETLLGSKVYNARSIGYVLSVSESLHAKYRALKNLLLTRQDLCPYGYLEFVENSILSTKPQSVLGAYIALWLVLCSHRVSMESARAG